MQKVKKQGEDVLHFLGGDLPLPPVGTACRGTLDWARRYELMLTLFAALATWLTFDAGVALAEGPRTLAYLAWTLPLAVHLGRRSMAPRASRHAGEARLRVWRTVRA